MERAASPFEEITTQDLLMELDTAINDTDVTPTDAKTEEQIPVHRLKPTNINDAVDESNTRYFRGKLGR